MRIWSLVPPFAYPETKALPAAFGGSSTTLSRRRIGVFFLAAAGGIYGKYSQSLGQRERPKLASVVAEKTTVVNPKKPKQFSIGWILGCICAAASGAVVAIAHHSGSPNPTSSNLPVPLRILVHFVAYINQPLCLFIFAVAAVVLVIRRRFQGIESLIASFLIAGIVAQLIRAWALY
jgi:hypothetical protein